jgi:stringent starvation protein B
MSALDTSSTSTRPYLIRALHEWCTDNGFSPYIAVQVDGSVQVPGEFVQNGEIVLNVSFDATSSLRLGNDCIEFKARFGGVAREIVVPISHVVAIYARENGQGMAFPAPTHSNASGLLPQMDVEVSSGPLPSPQEGGRAPLRAVPNDEGSGPPAELPDPPTDGPPRPGGRPKLKRVK